MKVLVAWYPLPSMDKSMAKKIQSGFSTMVLVTMMLYRFLERRVVDRIRDFSSFILNRQKSWGLCLILPSKIVPYIIPSSPAEYRSRGVERGIHSKLRINLWFWKKVIFAVQSSSSSFTRSDILCFRLLRNSGETNWMFGRGNRKYKPHGFIKVGRIREGNERLHNGRSSTRGPMIFPCGPTI